MSNASLVAALNDALPQTQCTRCGYADCRALCRGHRERRRTHQPVPAGRRRRHRPPGRVDEPGRPGTAQSGERHRRAAPARPRRRSLVHRLHAVPAGLPGRLHRRRAEADAHGHSRAVHRLRAVPSGLSGRLHRARRRDRRPDRLAGLEPGSRQPSRGERYAVHRARLPTRKRRARSRAHSRQTTVHGRAAAGDATDPAQRDALSDRREAIVAAALARARASRPAP